MIILESPLPHFHVLRGIRPSMAKKRKAPIKIMNVPKVVKNIATKPAKVKMAKIDKASISMGNNILWAGTGIGPYIISKYISIFA